MSVAQGLSFAKEQIEKTQNAFFRKEFAFDLDGVIITMNGKYKLVSIGGEKESLPLDSVQRLYDGVYDIVKHEEMKGYAKDRNLVRSKFKVDIAKFIPEVAEAVAFMDKRQTKILS
tara:strand:+ start:28788 stop:29135 length:348 start_codon:yes stop_codon:yes gene_type:complete